MRISFVLGLLFTHSVHISLSLEIVETTFGKVQGSFGESRDGRSFSQFLGIPYAQAQRFMPPTDPDSWSDVRNATKNGNACPQIQPNLAKPSENSIFTSEDCLNLNVYTPKVITPVLQDCLMFKTERKPDSEGPALQFLFDGATCRESRYDF